MNNAYVVSMGFYVYMYCEVHDLVDKGSDSDVWD